MKNYFISGLVTFPKEYPVIKLDRLVPQYDFTQTLLWNSCIKLLPSRWAQINGNHNLNKVHLVPIGQEIINHSIDVVRNFMD